MDTPFSDIWFEHKSRRKELLMLYLLRKQNRAVDDTFFPYGLVLADLSPWEVQLASQDPYTVGSDVERTVTYVSAALDYINRTSRKLGTYQWLFDVDRNWKQVSWSHQKFVPYQYDQAMAEQRVGKILMVAKIEQSKVDKDSIPWKYRCPDGTKLSGQLRWFPHGFEQHIDLFLKYNFLIVQNCPGGSYFHIKGPGEKKFMYAVANASIGSPITQVVNPPKFFYSLPEMQYESFFQNRQVALAPKRGLSGDLPSEKIEKRLRLGYLPDVANECHSGDFVQVPLSRGSEDVAQIISELIPNHPMSSFLPGSSVRNPNTINSDFPLNSIQIPIPQVPEDCIEISKDDFTRCGVQYSSSVEICDGPKIKEEPPHFAIQVSSSGGFGRSLNFMRN